MAHIVNKNNALEAIQDLKIEDGSGIYNHQQVHVDDISELCLDIVANITGQESDTTSQQTWKGCISRFSQRARRLYN